jgi:hypothetical protein
MNCLSRAICNVGRDGENRAACAKAMRSAAWVGWWMVWAAVCSVDVKGGGSVGHSVSGTYQSLVSGSRVP